MPNHPFNLQERWKKQRSGKQIIQRYAFYALAILLLFALNLIIARNVTGGVDFYVKWGSARIMHDGEMSVYSNAARDLLVENAKNTIYFSLSDTTQFTTPIYTLFLYFPFAWINDFELARALWMTICCILLVVGIQPQEKAVFQLQTKNNATYFLIAFLITNIFSAISIISGDTLIIALTLVLISLKHARKGNYELAGIFCGLATIQPVLAIVWVILLGIVSIREGNWGVVVWFIISSVLLVFSGFILQAGWTVEYLQTIILAIRKIPEILQFNSRNINQILRLTIPLIILIVEWVRTVSRVDRPQTNIWLFNLSLILFAIGVAPLKPEAFVLTIPAWVEIFDEWNKRQNNSAKVIGYINLSVYILFTILFIFVKPATIVNQQAISDTLLSLSSVHVLFNMYWIRGWLKQEDLKNYIEPA
ncbi:MAG TPA: hypothetical protein DCK95_04750 [Anaerolineaceae bacterium]|uniref:DUF2029 domain-containing protein n=1 Tax=Anaerolinea thermophila TaxID=167964 RepID=A0A101FYV5_9CHLR|nr:MAG: hypothetical protein XD73_0210 [Anaerolinea thermophila]HAF61616.1 hypothetical protein [Anaerolineaceae bacterium]